MSREANLRIARPDSPRFSLPTTFAKPIFPKGLDVVSQSGEKPDPASTLGDQAKLPSNKEAVNKAVQVK
ncbi:hypothetical protein PCANC_15421 [Puccinia coronata f. sp. avenae]|uniref:Uncharacterized protein n=1 Tax=Puccinia coronata f. sp. avenae TaxID=200324 RepID=A0A2N5SWL3_9BASI|nr:hypothetical protein PCANC_15421 [Puccinia coronata f. sp. avenae]